jgi:hypothetical protein
MRKESSLPVRLDTDAKVRLQNIGEAMGLTVSALVRMLVKSFVETYDRSGGKIVLPPMWKTTTTAYTAKAKPAKAAPRAKAAEPKAKKKTRSR